MSAARQNTKFLKNVRRSQISDADIKQETTFPQRVFLYLHPKSITCTLDDISCYKSEIELQHPCNKINILTDHSMERNIIQINEFDNVKPTFSITITQDCIKDITMLSDTPILLTLYVYTNRKSKINEIVKSLSITGDEEMLTDIRLPVAQGHIDIIQHFRNKRMHSTDIVFLYPLKTYGQTLSCKTEWEIYSIYPLLKNVQFTNFLHVTLGSLYNISGNVLDDGQNLIASLSFVTKIPNENNEYDKVFISDFQTFSKSMIFQQRLTVMWESVKSDNDIESISSMGISTESKINLNQLFLNLLTTENVEFNFKRININEEYALICNSMHRYVLTDNMQNILEDTLARNLYHIIIEIYSKLDKNKILLQGYLDLNIFMYPNVNNCSFAVELRPPDHKSNYQATTKKNLKKKGSLKTDYNAAANSQEQLINKENIPFAIIKIKLYSPITNPCQNIIGNSYQKDKQNYDAVALRKNSTQSGLRLNSEQAYRAFDDLILEIVDYIIVNNIKNISDDKEFFCHQLSNLNNKIMKLVACDFNKKIPTTTNIEFTNLITTVYRDLTIRIYDYINKCSMNNELQNCVFTITKAQNFIVENMTLAKYLYEVGYLEMANIIMNNLHTEYPNNSLLKFYLFLYDIERQNFDLVQNYLQLPLNDKDVEGELFADLIQIYINYKRQLQDSKQNQTADEDLLKAVSHYSMSHNPRSLTAFILLYCLYKRYNYQPGMAYCRWHYENLYDSLFIKLEFIPKSRWEIHMPHKINLKSLKGQNFFKVCVKLLRLGLYHFAHWVFDEISNECTEIEKYFFLSTLLIMENNLLDNFAIKIFPVDKYTNSIHLRASLYLVNGNLEHYRLPYGPGALKNYKDIANLKELEEYKPYQLGLLRCAYKMLEDQKYEEAGQIFLKLCNDRVNCIAAAVGRGKACYYLGQLDEAEKYFALSTEYNIYMASSWAYLALINLKKGRNYNALECWKYSRLHQNNEVHEEIINELNKINCSDIFIFVDIPNKV